MSLLPKEKFEAIARVQESLRSPVRGVKISSDKEKAAIFNRNQICVVYLTRIKVIIRPGVFCFKLPGWKFSMCSGIRTATTLY